MRILLIVNTEEKDSLIRKSLEEKYFIIEMSDYKNYEFYLASLNNYDLLLLDIASPEQICLEICKKVRTRKINTPIIILSVKSEIAFKVDSLNAGADDYMIKPFSLEELFARIKALLRRPKQIKNEILQIDNLFLDINKSSVKRGIKEVYLTRKEFMLLYYFLRNQGMILSRSMILENVWDINIDPFSNTIESHILSLRKKIDFFGQKKLIHTVNGRGYKMENIKK